VDVTGSRSCPVVGFGIIHAETLSFAAGELV
jgi:hypothetical protein